MYLSLQRVIIKYCSINENTYSLTCLKRLHLVRSAAKSCRHRLDCFKYKSVSQSGSNYDTCMCFTTATVDVPVLNI